MDIVVYPSLKGLSTTLIVTQYSVVEDLSLQQISISSSTLTCFKDFNFFREFKEIFFCTVNCYYIMKESQYERIFKVITYMQQLYGTIT